MHIASCTTQPANLDENAGLQTVINDALFLHNCDMQARVLTSVVIDGANFSPGYLVRGPYMYAEAI
jgi:hypothetical protein